MWENISSFFISVNGISDRDGDEVLTEEEFARLQVGEGGEGLLSQGETERREEFRMMLDADGDGKADRKELLVIQDNTITIIIYIAFYNYMTVCLISSSFTFLGLQCFWTSEL